VRLALQQYLDVVAIHFNADRFLLGGRRGLVRSFLEHGGETEKFSRGRLVHDDFLVVCVHSSDPDRAGDQDVGPFAGLADFVNALASSEIADFDLGGKDGGFIVIEQREEGHLAQDFRVAGHGDPPEFNH
jgi:hypothetical protein